MTRKSPRAFKPRGQKFSGREAGLTLLEVMIAMALLAFISIAIYQATSRSFELNFKLGAESNDYSALVLSLQAVESDLSQVFTPIMESMPAKPDQTATQFWSPGVRSDGLRRARFKGDKEHLTFITNSNRRVEADSPQSDFVKISWEVEKNNSGNYSLIRSADWDIYHYEENTAAKPTKVTLVDNLASVKFSYYRKENKTWEDNWDSENPYAKPGNRYPELISLKVEVPDPTNSAKQQQWELVVRPNLQLNQPTAEDKEREKQQFLE